MLTASYFDVEGPRPPIASGYRVGCSGHPCTGWLQAGIPVRGGVDPGHPCSPRRADPGSAEVNTQGRARKPLPGVDISGWTFQDALGAQLVGPAQRCRHGCLQIFQTGQGVSWWTWRPPGTRALRA